MRLANSHGTFEKHIALGLQAGADSEQLIRAPHELG
jgi:hypothetical protein